MLDCAACTATQRLTCPEGATDLVRALALLVAEPLVVAGVLAGFEVDVVCDVLGDGELLDVAGVGELVVGLGSLVGPLGVGVGVEPVGVGVGDGVGVELGDGVGSGSGWHCSTAVLAVATALVSSAAWVADAAMGNPVTVAASTPPATKPPTTGCTCAIRMRGPARAVRCFSGTNIRYGRCIKRGLPC
jgi:hypothetical protein